MLNKKNAMLPLIANGVYILYFFLMMILLKQPIINDLSKPPVQLSTNSLIAIQAAMSVLSIVIYIGLALVLKSYGEQLWIIASVYVYLVIQLIFNALSVMSNLHISIPYNAIQGLFYFSLAILLYITVAFLLVKNTVIKPYYRWFGITVLISIILVRALPYLYENYSISWALINQGLIKIIPFFISMFLFVKVSKSKTALS